MVIDGSHQPEHPIPLLLVPQTVFKQSVVNFLAMDTLALLLFLSLLLVGYCGDGDLKRSEHSFRVNWLPYLENIVDLQNET